MTNTSLVGTTKGQTKFREIWFDGFKLQIHYNTIKTTDLLDNDSKNKTSWWASSSIMFKRRMQCTTQEVLISYLEVLVHAVRDPATGVWRL